MSWTLRVQYDIEVPGRMSRVLHGEIKDLLLHLRTTKSWEKGATIFLCRPQPSTPCAYHRSCVINKEKTS